MHVAFVGQLSFLPPWSRSPRRYLLLCSFSFYREVFWLQHILGHDGANNMLMTSSLLYHIHTWEILDHSKGVFLAFSLVLFFLALALGIGHGWFGIGSWFHLVLLFLPHLLITAGHFRLQLSFSLNSFGLSSVECGFTPYPGFSFSFLRFLCVINIVPAFNKTFYFHFHKFFHVG